MNDTLNGPAELAASLERTTANLESYVETCAAEVAAPRIAELEARVAEAEAETARAHQRFRDLQVETQRRFTALERNVAKGTWLAAYLPAKLRRIAGYGDRRFNPSLLDPQWREDVDRAAAECGLGAEVPTATTGGG